MIEGNVRYPEASARCKAGVSMGGGGSSTGEDIVGTETQTSKTSLFSNTSFLALGFALC
jgi:hypothetical protein